MYVVQSFLYLREDFLCYENIFNYNKENKGKKQKMKIAICDDEKKASEALLEILEECPEPIEKTDVYFSGEELLRSTEQYDLLFLDIDMEGIDGIETARKIRLKDKKVKIVYVTAYSEYAGKAFSVHAFGYLLKPVKKTSVLKQVADALAYREEEQKPSPVLEFETSQGRTRLHTADIYYFEIRGRQIKLAAEKGIPCQVKEAVAGGNDAGAIHVSRGGVRTAAVSLACRYLHSPVGMIAEEDFHHAEELVEAMAMAIAGGEAL